MAVWDIDVAGATSTLTGTAAQVEATRPSVAGMGTAFEEAEAAIPRDAPVVLAALDDVVTLRLAPAATEVASRAENVITATAQALAFYQQGDLVMATAAQRAAGLVDHAAVAAPVGGSARRARD
ncbi:DUF6507 family protein [Paenarthrobacter sp. NPDC056912]|uniref:DUF6507 family protein n=1 Tax=Paenarthrobacter sp. NPDC056912 TaxID=3345965 RepID=UPI00366E7B9E